MLKVGDKLLCKKLVPLLKEKYKYYIITNINSEMIHFLADYYLNKNKTVWYLWKYFYTPQELRKMKLERLKQ